MLKISKKLSSLRIFYKFDNTNTTKTSNENQENKVVDKVIAEEKQKADNALKNSPFNPMLFVSLSHSLREFQLETHDPAGKALAKAYQDILEEHIQYPRNR